VPKSLIPRRLRGVVDLSLSGISNISNPAEIPVLEIFMIFIFYTLHPLVNNSIIGLPKVDQIFKIPKVP
jgi:hypothetical protein